MFSLFAGSLSDDFGRKPLIIFPIAGTLIGTIFKLINYGFIHQLPTEFFFATDSWCHFFGGGPIYYLGVYGYGAMVAEPQNRVKLMARYDAMELVGSVLGKYNNSKLG